MNELIEKAMEDLREAFKIIEKENMELIDAFSSRKVYELREAVMFLKNAINTPKKDNIAEVIAELIKDLYNKKITEEEFVDKIKSLNN